MFYLGIYLFTYEVILSGFAIVITPPALRGRFVLEHWAMPSRHTRIATDIIIGIPTGLMAAAAFLHERIRERQREWERQQRGIRRR